MSMSTPLSNIPLKTQHVNDDNNDINDPMVQDVLNEFQEELLTTQNQSQNIQQPVQVQYQKPVQSFNHPSHQQVNNNFNKNTINYNDDKFPYSYIKTELLQKSLIIVIIVILVFYSGIIPQLYEKSPQYLNEMLEKYDIYVKALIVFVVVYLLFLFNYI